MAEKPQRKARKVHAGRVEKTERLSPHMVRVEFGGEGLAEFAVGEWTDSYVKLLFPPPGVEYAEPFDMEAVRAERPREEWPVTRTYTVRSWDAAERRLVIDFVYHGDAGLAGPWAAAARPGDVLRFFGPGGGYAPSAEVGRHLFAGDESALPAIAASVEALPEDAVGHAFIEVAGPEEEQAFRAPAGLAIHWLHRADEPVGRLLASTVQEFEFPEGRVQAFVHGEANAVKSLRRDLRVRRGIDREDLSISGYWRLGRDEEGWQSSKAEWNRSVEEEEEAAIGATS